VYVVTEADNFATMIDAIDVFRLLPCGGSAPLLGSRTTPSNTGGATAAFVGSDRVFVVMGDGVYSVPTSGGAMTTETTSSLIDAPLTLSGDQIYWVDSSPTLWAVEIGGGHTPRMIAQDTTSDPPAWTSVAADATNAYVTVNPRSGVDSGVVPDAGEGEGSILAIPLSGGSGITLATELVNPGGVIVANGSLYFTTYTPGPPSVDNVIGSGGIESLALPAGAPIGLVINEFPAPASLVMLGTTLYWVDSEILAGSGGSDTVRSLPAGGVPATVSTPAINGLDQVVVAASGIFWASAADQVFGESL
jgi:hypothetical protein